MASTVTLALMSLMICCTARLMTARPSVGSSRRAATACRKSKSSCSNRTAMQAVFLGMLFALLLAALDLGEDLLGKIHGRRDVARVIRRSPGVQTRRGLEHRVPPTLGGIGVDGKGRRAVGQMLAECDVFG